MIEYSKITDAMSNRLNKSVEVKRVDISKKSFGNLSVEIVLDSNTLRVVKDRGHFFLDRWSIELSKYVPVKEISIIYPMYEQDELNIAELILLYESMVKKAITI